MVAISLPDGSTRVFDKPITGAELASDIGAGLAKAAIAIRVNGVLKDLAFTVSQDVQVEIITERDSEALELIRHDTAHVLAEAVQELFPGTQVTIGPNIENGFYYDFARDEPFSVDDLEIIEAKMGDIVDRNKPFERQVWERKEAIEYFKNKGETYKAEIIADLPPDEEVSIYTQGDWTDLCRGPHLPSTGHIGKAFKLMKVAGAYWRGDPSNKMLQRIYGTAWRNPKELRRHLLMIEEAEKRDHRRLGREMGLFHFQEEAPGAVFWHAKGWKMFSALINYMRTRQERAGYVEISTPTVMDRSLWERSGHWGKFGDNMFLTQTEDDRQFALKPMNCPGCIQVYKQGITSYRDLPRRIAEFGKVNRYEPSGALHGLMRVREFTQDDAHIFCTPEQTEQECRKVIELIMDIYKDFGFADVRIKFSDRPENRIGSDEVWDQLEAALKGALETMGYTDYSYNSGEGAFYGPKLEFVLRDAIGRDWQCGTLQVDMNLPERLDVHYIDENGQKKRPVMLHRALFGSLERFTGILIENYAGNLPFWLAPLQVVVATITNDTDDYAKKVVTTLRASGLCADTDLRNEKINYKIREHSHAKIPVILVVGAKEAEAESVAMRRLGGKAQEILALQDAVDRLRNESISPAV
ncbi:MAG: threonine--tRNA ligase [Rhodospirillaceae bacterium TMED8]|nr:threonine--tRNA ligase [Magnetovibrio sp.]OUT47772.1 MAG: threonine--tRNA ligase [Rhodospirillaceae bacterium TMED8]|tara:strand:+ start:599 stop:2518 length:1920 start_codon:yes stop_codon:yes gene_type:complete